MHDFAPPLLETFSYWPSWLNARGHLDRSACFELKVSEVRRLAGCVPMKTGPTGKVYRAKRRWRYPVTDLPNERKSHGSGDSKRRISSGWWDIDAFTMQWVLDGRLPRGLAGDWRTGRAPAMRLKKGDSGQGQGGSGKPGMTLEQGGYGPGSYAYERREEDFIEHGLDAGLSGNPNRGATREKKFGLDDAWRQRLWLEKWRHNSVSGVQYFLLCPGSFAPGPDASTQGVSASACRLKSTVGAKGLKGLTGTTSNCGDGSRGAHGKGWVCGQRVYKLYWVLARPEEVQDAELAERWINGLSSGQLARRSAEVLRKKRRAG